MTKITPHDNPTHVFNIDQVKGNPYAILGVPADASNNMIKRAYKMLAAIYHPDVFKGDEQIFLLITKAKECLLDEKKRALYDDFFLFGDALEGIPSRAYTKIKTMLRQVVEGATQLDETDIKASMLAGVDEAFGKINNDLINARVKIKKFEKMMTRISSHVEGESKLISLLKADLQVSVDMGKAVIATIKAEELVFDQVIILLDDFECTFEKAQEQDFGSATTAGRW